MAGEQTGPDVTVNNVSGGQSADVRVSAEDQAAANAAAAESNEPSAASFGVSDEQFRKYYSADTKEYNWQAHAKEVEYKAGQVSDDTAGDDTKDKGEADKAAATAVEQAGLDFASLETQIVESGDIGEDEYKALASIGIPEDIVKEYIANIKMRATDQVEEVIDAFGGDENLAKVRAWAHDNYTEAELLDIDKSLSDPNRYKATVDMLRQRAGVIPGNVGEPAKAPNAFGGGDDGVKGYASDAEMQVDIRNPKYKTDPAFRQEVTRRVAASQWTSNPRAHSGGL